MLIIGCDFHPGVQQISFVDRETGEYGQMRLDHKKGEAERYYRSLAGRSVRVGVEATGRMRWFERLLEELGFELWVADPRKVRAAAAHQAKTDKKDAELLLRLLLEDRFPRLWIPARSSGRRASWCSTGTGWCRLGREPRTSCRLWPATKGCGGGCGRRRGRRS